MPDLWLDVFQKMVAAGFNTASIYVHQGLSNPAPGVLDFDGVRALQPLFDAATQAGIFILLRPGPYINAETTAGGLALWATSTTVGTLRTNETGVMEGWEQYIKRIAELVRLVCAWDALCELTEPCIDCPEPDIA